MIYHASTLFGWGSLYEFKRNSLPHIKNFENISFTLQVGSSSLIYDIINYLAFDVCIHRRYDSLEATLDRYIHIMDNLLTSPVASPGK